MKSLLEQTIVHLLNNDEGKASELFHKFIVSKAREIHESMRQGEDDVLDDDWSEDVTSEQYFSEAELDSIEDGADEVDADADMVAGDLDAGADADVDMGADLGADMGGDADMDLGADLDAEVDVDGGEDMGTDERLEDIEDQLERLTAEFEQMMADLEGEDDSAEMADDLDDMGDDVTGADADVDVDADADADADVDGEEEEVKEAFGDDDDFDDITESVIAELDKVITSLEDGVEAPAGKKFDQNRSSAVASKTTPKGVVVKPDNHKSFEREPAPGSKEMGVGKNVRKKSTDGNSAVSKEGDKSAALNKDKEANNPSPISGKK